MKKFTSFIDEQPIVNYIQILTSYLVSLIYVGFNMHHKYNNIIPQKPMFLKVIKVNEPKTYSIKTP